ncbi:protein kinase domain-containing protein [Fervidobacterium gondwanense]|uniref:Protein kinase domain-containing protein n=1 Tax=Fervidobacterium gondwanense DSM 13020 TaxID=1121883 RepID=A0A1M7TG95_FERGO|nr:protein kinase [Fervidobacterium gondwanense]SHN69740.1 Protein kinase domain-containing protein [Fervidobacterium gondwanense DSM 13020]
MSNYRGQNIVVLGENEILIEKNGKKYLLPHYIDGQRYEVTGILSANTGFGLILNAVDHHVFKRRVLIKARNYFGKIRRNNLDNKQFLVQARNDIKAERRVLELIRDINIPNTPVLRDYIEGYNPSLKWPEGDFYAKPYKDLEEEAYKEPYIVLQYIEGDTLENVLNSQITTQKLTSPEWRKTVFSLVKTICKIFRKLYRIGKRHESIAKIIYQDLKLDNIIVTPSWNFTLIDFGGVGVIKKDNKTYNLGRVYTPGYKAPEIDSLANRMVDEKVDVYTIGVVVYRLLTKVQITTDNILPNQTLKFDYSLLSKHNNKLIEEFVRRTTEPDPDKRIGFDDMTDMVYTILKNILTNQ